MCEVSAFVCFYKEKASLWRRRKPDRRESRLTPSTVCKSLIAAKDQPAANQKPTNWRPILVYIKRKKQINIRVKTAYVGSLVTILVLHAPNLTDLYF